MARARKLDDIDYYDLLGVDRDAPADAIKQAFHAFAHQFHPDQHRGQPEVARKSARIYSRGTEAYRVLCNPETRRQYDAGLEEGRLRFDPTQVHHSQRASLPAGQAGLRSGRARPFVTKAEQALRSRNYALAKLNLQIALQHEPGNAELERKLQEVLAKLRGG